MIAARLSIMGAPSRIAWLEAAANGNILPRIRQHPSPDRDVVA